MKTHITYNKFIYNDHENAQLYFQQNFQGGFLDPDAAIVIEKAINQLLKKDNILRNENIPNDDQTISEEEYVKKHQEDDNYYKHQPKEKKEEGIQNDENLDYDDLEQRND
jgi:hypothetical protein